MPNQYNPYNGTSTYDGTSTTYPYEQYGFKVTCPNHWHTSSDIVSPVSEELNEMKKEISENRKMIQKLLKHIEDENKKIEIKHKKINAIRNPIQDLEV